MKRIIVMLGSLLLFIPGFADMTWQTPVGTIGIPLTATEALVGYDAVLRQAVGGFSLPVYSSPQKLLSLQVGAVAPWQTHDATIEPYAAGGIDVLREMPVLQEYKSCHLNVFGRYASAQGKAGLGVSFSYSFASSN